MADLTFLDLIEGKGREHPSAVKRMLKAPWLWPTDADESARVVALTAQQEPEERAPGHTLLVSWVPGTPPGACLHEFGPGLTPDGTTMGLDALNAKETARLVGVRSAPFIASCAALDDVTRWGVRFLLRDHESPAPPVLDGKSFGLPMVLATVAQSVGLSIPRTVAATGTVSGDGSVGIVQGLGEKVALIDRCARGVTTLLVPAGQGAEARTSVRRQNLNVIEVASADDALRIVFPKLQEALVQVRAIR